VAEGTLPEQDTPSYLQSDSDGYDPPASFAGDGDSASAFARHTSVASSHRGARGGGGRTADPDESESEGEVEVLASQRQPPAPSPAPSGANGAAAHVVGAALKEGSADGLSGLDSVSMLLPQRMPTEPGEVQAVLSQLAVGLRTSELQRRHMVLQAQALKNEQARLVGQLQGMARRERELEEHVVLLSQAGGEGPGGNQPPTLRILRGTMLEAARAEAERLRREAEAATRARDKALAQLEESGKASEAVVRGLREELSRLTEQLGQRAVLQAVQEREGRDRERRFQRQEQRVRGCGVMDVGGSNQNTRHVEFPS
jgi:hypothetical protein